MLKRVLKGGVVYASADMLRKLSPFILLPLYVSNLSVGDFGRLEYITIISSLFSYVIAWGSTQGLLRLFSEDGPKYVFISILIATSIALILSVTILLLSLYADVSKSLGVEGTIELFLCIIYGWVFAMNNVAFTILRYEEQLKKFAVLNVLSTSVQVGSIIFMLLYLELNYISKISGLVISNSVMMVVLYVYVIRHHIQFSGTYSMLKRALRFYTPLAFHNTLSWGGGSIDKVAVKGILGDDALGAYSLMIQVAQIFKLAIESFLKSLNAVVYKEESFKIYIQQHRFWFVFVLQIVASIYLLFVFVFSESEIFSQYQFSIEIFVLLLISRSLLLSNYLEVLMFYAEVKSKEVFFSSAFSFFVLVSIIFGLVGAIGLKGAAYSLILSALAAYGALNYQRERRIKSTLIVIGSVTSYWSAIIFTANWLAI